MTKKKIYLSLFITLFIIAVVCFFSSYHKVNAYDLFNEENVSVSYNQQLPEEFISVSTEKGVLFSGNTDNSSVSIKEMSGDFSFKFYGYSKKENSYSKLNNITFTFSNCLNDDVFSLVLESRNDNYNCYVLCKGVKAGIYTVINSDYQYASGLYEMTAYYNSNGLYTFVENSKANCVTFEQETLSLKVDNNLVWSFSEKYNDGRDIGVLLNGFEKYDVKISFGETGTTSYVMLYELNGQRMLNQVIEQTVAPAICAKIDNNGIVGKNYVIPKPYVYDIVDGSINENNVLVSLYFQNAKIFEKKYSSGLFFVPENSGEYTIRYSVKNNKNIVGTAELFFSIYDESDSMIKIVSDSYESNVGKGASIDLSNATVSGSLYKNNVTALISVFKENTVMSEYDGIPANVSKTLTFSELGVYKIRYYSPYVCDDVNKEFIVNVTDIPYLTLSQPLESTYSVGQIFNVPNAEINFDGQSVSATAITVYPNNVSYYNTQFELTEPGVYTIKYLATLNNVAYSFEKKFNVIVSGLDLFELDGGSLSYGTHSLNNKYSGVRVKQSVSGTLLYNKIIDLSDNGRYDKLIELVVDPSTIGNADVSQLIITLEDLYDETNFITIVVEDSGTINGKGALSFVRTSHSGLQLGCFSPTATEQGYGFIDAGKWQGSQCYHSFMGTLYTEANPQVPLQSLKLFFDYENKSLYHANLFDSYMIGLFRNQNKDHELIADYDSSECYRDLWQGFTNGMCRLKITTSGTSQANYIIMNIDGTDFSKPYIEKDANQFIYVDLPNVIPNAVINKQYKIFDANVIGSLFDYKLNTKVYINYDYNGGSEIQCQDGYFTPKTIGEYTIIYEVCDCFGRILSETVKVNCVAEVEPVSLKVLVDGVKKGVVNQEIELCNVTANGGSGEVKISTKIVCLADGTEIDSVDGYFKPNKSGEYRVTVTAEDYIKNSDVYEYTVTVETDKNPVWENSPVIPKAFISGADYVLSEIYAVDYYTNESSPIRIQAIIKATDANGERTLTDGKYIPQVSNDGDTVKIVYSATSVSGSVEKEFTVPCYIAREVNVYSMQKYFYTSNVQMINATDEYLGFESNSDYSIAFVKPLDATNFNVVFHVDKQKNNANYIILTLQDSINYNEKIIIRIIPNGNSSIMCVNNGANIDISGSFESLEGTNYQFVYNNKTFGIMDSSGKVRTIVRNTSNGQQWTGFSSGKVYFSAEVCEVSGNFALQMISLNSQGLSKYASDIVSPTLSLSGDIGGEVSLNGQVTVPLALSCDVLSNIGSLTVSVRMPNNAYAVSVDGITLKNVSANREYVFIASSIGLYRIEYITVDTSRRELETNLLKKVYVADRIAPTVKVNGSISKEVNLGKTITLPSVSYTDNVDAVEKINAKVFVIEPDNIMINVENGKYTFRKKGQYVIEYFVYDSSMNYKLIKYNITVK